MLKNLLDYLFFSSLKKKREKKIWKDKNKFVVIIQKMLIQPIEEKKNSVS